MAKSVLRRSLKMSVSSVFSVAVILSVASAWSVT